MFQGEEPIDPKNVTSLDIIAYAYIKEELNNTPNAKEVR